MISIGTNSTRYLLVEFSEQRPERPRILGARSLGTRVGEGLRESGRLAEVPMARTLEAVRAHCSEIAGRYDRIFTIATSAVRRAENAAAFALRVEALTGSPLTILSGQEEARASFRGAAGALPHGRRAGVLDTGGGSTEYAVGTSERVEAALSCEIGAVRLTERLPALAGSQGAVDAATIRQAREEVRVALAPIAGMPDAGEVFLVGGSATSAAALLYPGIGFESAIVVERPLLQHQFDVLCSLPLERRKAIAGMNPQRADILPAGMLVLLEFLDLTGHHSATVSLKDLLYGYLLEVHERERTTP